jgi:hypothetical protein
MCPTNSRWQSLRAGGLAIALGLLAAGPRPAYGTDLVITDTNPELIFDSTAVNSPGLGEWDIHLGETMTLTIFDCVANCRDVLSLASSPSNAGSLLVDASGNLHLADDALFIDRGPGTVGIGTIFPLDFLHVADTAMTSSVRLENQGSTWRLNWGPAGLWLRNSGLMPVKFENGAPTNSLVVAPSGNVGLGTSVPQGRLHLSGAAAEDVFSGMGPSPNLGPAFNFGYSGASFGRGSGFLNVRPDASAVAPNPSLRFATANVQRMIITNTGNVGLGVSSPSQPLQMASGAFVSAGGVWTNASSREAKQDIAPLALDEARAALVALEPVTFAYRADPAERHVGFIAEDVPDLVASAGRTGLSPMDMVAVLTRVVQDQQRALADLAAEVAALKRAAGR